MLCWEPSSVVLSLLSFRRWVILVERSGGGGGGCGRVAGREAERGERGGEAAAFLPGLCLLSRCL